MLPTHRNFAATVLTAALIAGPIVGANPLGAEAAGGGPVMHGPAVLGAGGVRSPRALPSRSEVEASHARGRILVIPTVGLRAPLLAGAVEEGRLDRSGIEVLDVPDVATAIAAYRGQPQVVSVEADRPARIAAAPNDHLYGAQWTLHPSSGPTAPSPFTLNWEAVHPALQADGVTVAVLDTGYRTGGTDQVANLRLDLARNFVNPAADTSDDNGHGTFVTNIIAEATDNAIGAAGIAPHANIVPVKVLASDGTGDLSVVARGINYAASIGAQVINLSLAGDQSPALCQAVTAAVRTAVVVAASGNDATASTSRPIAYPAACPGALAIGSVAIDGSRPGYANTGCQMAAVSPGGDDLRRVDPASPQSDWILQQGYDGTPGDPTFGTFQYFEEEGTSMSSAQAAGEAALLIGAGASPSRARRLMLGTARPVSSTQFTPAWGSGALDIAAAVGALGARPWAAPMLRGYRIVTASGRVTGLGDPCQTSAFEGEVTGSLAQAVVGTAATPSGNGYWLVASDGGIFSFGDAAFHGSTGAMRLNKPIVGMAPTPSGDGYWLVASDGGIFSFGDAAFHGSTGAIVLNKPIVGMTATPSGNGYWLVASDGGIFSFGDAAFHGSTGAISLVSPIVGMASTPSGNGYWLVASDGGIFSFGDAAFAGSTGGIRLASAIVGMIASTDGGGYALVAADGGIFNFGDAPFFGSAAGATGRVVGIAPEPWPGL